MHLMLAFSLQYILTQHSAPVISGIAAGLVCKAYYAVQSKNKIKDQQEIFFKSQQRIYELEVQNERLKKRLQEMETYFSKDHIILN
jgi:hypothetical protein